MSPSTKPSIPVSFYLLSVFLLACLAVALIVLRPDNFDVTSRFFVGLLAFIILAILGESFPINLPMGSAKISMSGTIYWALIVIYDPIWAALCSFIAFLFTDTIIRQKSLSKGIFNASQVGLSTLVASLVFLSISGSSGLAASFNFFAGFVAAVIAYWLLNTWLVSCAAYLLYAELPHRFWQQNFQWAWIYEVTSAPVALAVAYAYESLWIMGLLLLALPILMLRLAYSQYIDLKKTYRETVRTLIKIIEMHDPYTAGHSDRVATYSRRLCEALNVSPAKTERIELAAYLHDLGKIHLDLTGIVRKAGKLTEEERRMVRLHPVMSADLANQVSYFRGEIEAMIRHHHENWNGTGYPHGLKEEEIPFGSRIILLADAFDAMTTSRVYRDALDLEKVKNEFRKFAGVQFDPDLVPVFLEQVVGDGDRIVMQPVDEPLEGQRARSLETQVPADVHPLPRRVIG